MKTVKLNQSNFAEILSGAERISRSGGIVSAPTDTVYGILGDATRPEVIKRIFDLKQRPEEKVFPIFVKDITAARKYAYISDEKAKFLEKIWPGPVTAVFHHKEKLPTVLTGGKNTIGIRIPNHKFLLELLSRIDFPLVQTSANISGHRPGKTVEDLKKNFSGLKVKPDLIIDGGKLGQNPSTVIDFTGKEPIILRTGLVSKSELDAILGSM